MVTTISNKYTDCFGFTFGNFTGIYNPWSIINYLDKKIFKTYWANTSSNSLVDKLIREGSRNIKLSFEAHMRGETLTVQIDECQIVYNQLGKDESAIWSLLLASGHLKVKTCEVLESYDERWRQNYELEITNYEVNTMLRDMIRGWFRTSESDYNDFIKALLLHDVEAMNVYMNKVALSTFSFFDTGRRPSNQSEPEWFYHGFVLGLMVELAGRYSITSNRESGFGRYDIILEPKMDNLDAIIMEFKVHNPNKEQSLEEIVRSALAQIEEKSMRPCWRKRA